jgi:hypothetical protein
MESRLASITEDFRGRGIGGVVGNFGMESFEGVDGSVSSGGKTRPRGTPSPSLRRTRSIFCMRVVLNDGIKNDGRTRESRGESSIGLIVCVS